MSTSVKIIDRQRIIEDFHKLWYHEASKGGTWAATKWFGHSMLKSPFDMFLYADLVWDVKPALIIETGTHEGGSALFFAHLLDQLSHGRVISIDLKPMQGTYPRHPRIDYLCGHSSASREVLDDMPLAVIGPGQHPVMVILDSDHAKDHVLAELDAYADLVTPGSYLVVEDTNVNGHPVYPDHGPGPYEALEEWLPNHPEFKDETPRMVGKYLVSFHSWLRRRRD